MEQLTLWDAQKGPPEKAETKAASPASGRAPRESKTGRELRDAGMECVAEHAGLWKDMAALAAGRWFAALPYGARFSGEDIRAAVLPITGAPHHPNAWGAVIGGRVRDWLRTGWIVVDGMKTADSKASHAHTYRQYRKRSPGEVAQEP